MDLHKKLTNGQPPQILDVRTYKEMCLVLILWSTGTRPIRVWTTLTLADGSIYADCLQTVDWNPLAPETIEYKFYAPWIGMIKEQVVGSDEDPVELVVD